MSTQAVSLRPIAPGPRRRHEARVQRFSADPGRLADLDVLGVEEDAARQIVSAICASHGVEEPDLRFHARRSPYTGVTEQPRWMLVDDHGEDAISQLERSRRRPLAPFGTIRLGRSVTLMTIAHELGHHLVFSLDPASTPSHGKRWVERFDAAAEGIHALISSAAGGDRYVVLR